MFTNLSTESESKNNLITVKILMFSFIFLTIVFGYFGYKYFLKSINKEVAVPTTTDTNTPKSVSKNAPSNNEKLVLTEEQKRIQPNFHTSPLTTAILNSKYQATIFASVPFEGELGLTYETLPEGLSLTNCETEFNSSLAKTTPNTLITCLLEGTPTKAGDYVIKITAMAKGAVTSTFQNFPLTVVDSSGL